MRKYLLSILIYVFICACINAQITPQDAIKQMGRGTNIGNTMECEYEGTWNNGPVQEYYFDDFKTAGFQTIRIPVRWDKHTDTLAPYKIDPIWMKRVEQVVDWGLSRGFFIILNAHHEEWIKWNYKIESKRNRFDSIWSQIAVHFKNKSDKLLFEIINEPKGMNLDQINDLNAREIVNIRKTNPNRIIIFSGTDYTTSQKLIETTVPNDKYLMAYFHSYDPWSFAGEAKGKYGKPSDIEFTKKIFDEVANWSKIHNVPVMVSEFGTVSNCDYNSRMSFYAAYVEQALEHNIAFQVWDDGGGFGIYQRKSRSWNEIKDILIHTYKESPTSLTASIVNDSCVFVKWVNRTIQNDSILIQRKSGKGNFVTIAKLNKNATEFVDTNTKRKTVNMYRLITNIHTTELHSYPVQIRVLSNKPSIKTAYQSKIVQIPGIIEAENFDEGGEGVSYHDENLVNMGDTFRTEYAVDIESLTNGGFQVSHVETGEWLDYTINVAKTDEYMIDVYLASKGIGGTFTLQFNNTKTELLKAVNTNSWETSAIVSTKFKLIKGEQIMKLIINSTPSFNIDKIVITPCNK
jgi:aryl-phospho-beta-D-glucosidase BglC (GH1 family)